MNYINTTENFAVKKYLHLKNQGFTLIEIMVVVVIIGIMALMIVPTVINKVDEARITKAKSDIRTLESQLEMYRIDTGSFPTTDQGLTSLVKKTDVPPVPTNWQGPYIQRLPKDPWGNNYQYVYPSKHGGQFDIYSYGSAGKDGDNKNFIGSWDL